MDRRFYTNSYDDPENGPGSPSSGDEAKINGSPSPKKRKGAKKRVVSVPISDVEGSKSKGDAYPPPDSWAWRKYGQKPIKGSPFPRGYYRCSSSKGCPARKQVERSNVDPTMLIITYQSDHNHSLPTSTKHHHHQPTISGSSDCGAASPDKSSASASTDAGVSVPAKATSGGSEVEFFNNIPPDLQLIEDQYGWYGDVAVLESPIYAGNSNYDADVAMAFKMGEEEESLFADLGELPECSLVFKRSLVVQCGGSTL
ncbi:WRKY transcription factor 65 [Tripterygium wilfordii]|uniref:WRKY transcription factor 2 n=1 Tax=Tripterygium wilfordii TaxID=458696 RepID=A0A499SW95_TRIWF|nr:probable WRKY transcription factor 69 [Tripterygium wilfordii]AZP54648.1 WRKY transcription factor 2 [Tripterygium wilfordii]KAF5732556.1 WRKY transcription factor 65 [Tripterygium wilfordii]